ncbi:MAG: ACP S-malonyltransferase [Rhodothermales bacterium]
MSQTAFLFPGQGSQYVGMARDLYERFDGARRVIDEADRVLDVPLSAIMFGTAEDRPDAEEALKQTDVTQPALYVHSMAVMAVLRRRAPRPSMVAGHSLGEYSALAAAGALSFEDGLRLVRRRGQLMAGAGDARPGTMAAVLGMDDDEVVQVCAEATKGTVSVVEAANFNAPGQVVISGDVDAVERAMSAAGDRGARRVVPLPVSGAFHSPLMDYAREGLQEALEKVEIQRPECPVYLNVTGEPSRDPDEIRRRLVDQLTAPVRWSHSLRAMQEAGAGRFVEVGAGRVLSGLVRRTLGRDVDTVSAEGADDVAALLESET